MSNLLLSKIGHVISEFPLAFKQTKEVKLFMGHRTKRFFQWSGKMGERF